MGLTKDFITEVAKGNVAGHSLVGRSARNPLIGTTIEDIWTIGGTRTWLTANTTLEVLSDDANDTSAGSGARTVTVEGVQLDGTVVSQDVTMNGTTPVDLGTDIARVNKMFVKTAGAYGATTGGSNAGNIICRVDGGGASQAEILLEDTVPEGASQTSHYSVPAGKTAYLIYATISVDDVRSSIDIFLRARQNYDNVSAPFDPVKTIMRFDGVNGTRPIVVGTSPIGGVDVFPEKTDIWFAGFASTGSDSDVTVQYILLLVDN